MLKNVVSIPGISMTYILNKALKMKKTTVLMHSINPKGQAPGDSPTGAGLKSAPDLYAQGQTGDHKCNASCSGISCAVNPRKEEPKTDLYPQGQAGDHKCNASCSGISCTVNPRKEEPKKLRTCRLSFSKLRTLYIKINFSLTRHKVHT